MSDVTEVILNFQKLLVAVAKSLSAIGLFKGSDEWEELTESAFHVLVVNHLSEEFDCTISQQYEFWDQNNQEIVVQVDAGASILIGVKDEASECKYNYYDIPKNENAIGFSFVEFGNPSFSEEDFAGLEHVVGFDEDGRVICARKQDCKFFAGQLEAS